MLKKYLNVIQCFMVLLFFASCATTASLHPGDDKIKTGVIDEADYLALKQILSGYATAGLNDTILIKYDYNNETCWDRMDERDDNHIQGFINRHNERVRKVSASRKNVSVFQFKEPGKNFNKLKKRDNAIAVDSSKQLYKLLFKKRAICGNSIAILPDRRYVFIRSDSHSDVLDLTHEKMIGYLGGK